MSHDPESICLCAGCLDAIPGPIKTVTRRRIDEGNRVVFCGFDEKGRIAHVVEIEGSTLSTRRGRARANTILMRNFGGRTLKDFEEETR